MTNQRYEAFKAKDARFDGKFFVGVISTGIYCRPTCRAKLPKEENCTYYHTAASAESAGYRPCLLCRPELAPGIANITTSLAVKAAMVLEKNCGNISDLKTFAERFGCTDRHLRRLFVSEYGVSPIQYLQTCKLLLAKNLLTDTDLSVAEIASTAGFGSMRRFDSLFKEKYKLSPTELRKQVFKGNEHDGTIVLYLGYRPPYLWDEMIDFLSHRAISGIETVKDGEYSRTVHIWTKKHGDIYGWFSVGNRPHRNDLRISISISLLPVLSIVLSRIRDLFDLHCDPDTIYDTLMSMNDIRPGLCREGVRLPGCFDPFEMSVRAVLGQQITVKAAGTLAARMTKAYGKEISTDVEGLTHVFPSPKNILCLKGPIDEHLGPLGITSMRANTILRLAEMFELDHIGHDMYADHEIVVKELMSIPGIGKWTANYIAMRTMGCTDVFLDTDLGIKKALSPLSQGEISKLSEKWIPWRSYATINLWNSLKTTE